MPLEMATRHTFGWTSLRTTSCISVLYREGRDRQKICREYTMIIGVVADFSSIHLLPDIQVLGKYADDLQV
ncbi:hypothetical protein KC19_1G285700 [Ceratodon purpureus]|uniref:Uncharacterized protein n=1 Tax=Ceratodon purpureus TaxID=3225 RepID=A0A8T0JCU9_CERPU|nr:hypothetical protein KC19_1G285700 [Ceratodon purpureus]